MKKARLGTIFLSVAILGIVGGCFLGQEVGGRSTLPPGTPPTSPSPVPSRVLLTPTPQARRLSSSTDSCFGQFGLIPGKTTKEEVIALWGEPDEVFSTSGTWRYRVVGRHHAEIYVSFSGDQLDYISAWLRGCTLGDLISTLGAPEAVGIVPQDPSSCPPICPNRIFYYPKHGAVFISHCLPDCSGGTVEECEIFCPADEVNFKDFYPATTMEALLEFYHPSHPPIFVQWNGFSEGCQDDVPAP